MNGRNEKGHFLPGNRFWEARSSCGPNPKFDGPEPLWAAICEYFEWNEANPLYADQLVTFQGSATHEPIAKMRAMSVGGLCMFLDITQKTWIEWRSNRADLSEVIARAEMMIYRQKFEGASADLLNGSIIARDLGLAERKEVSGPDKGPIKLQSIDFGKMSTGAIEELLRAATDETATSEPE